MNLRLILGFVACVALPGCVVEADDGPHGHAVGVGSGSLVLDWSIDGSKNPDQCDQSDSTTIDITIVDQSGAEFGEYEQSCAAFATTVDLPPGHYRASAVLTSGGHDRTTAVQTGGFDIYGDDELSIPVDFPASSFY